MPGEHVGGGDEPAASAAAARRAQADQLDAALLTAARMVCSFAPVKALAICTVQITRPLISAMAASVLVAGVHRADPPQRPLHSR